MISPTDKFLILLNLVLENLFDHGSLLKVTSIDSL